MPKKTVDTIIIGGGLSGIYSAYLLSQRDISFVILEARERIGGRILSPEHQGFFSDLGPSWYWPSIHPKMKRLIQAVGLHGYRQYETGMGRFQNANGTVQNVGGYPTEPPSCRLSGGMMALIEKLSENLPANAIRLNHPVCHIEQTSCCTLRPTGHAAVSILLSGLGAGTIHCHPVRSSADV